MGVKRSNPDQYQLRFPPGLRDRIKAYAERHGRSMNTEIVRVLEREFPEQWDVDARMEHLGEMVSILRAGTADPRIDQFISDFRDTVEGVITGRLTGVSDEARKEVSALWAAYVDRESEDAYEAAKDAQAELDPEELWMLELTGRMDKFAEPPPRKKDYYEMTPEEQEAYLEELRSRPPDPNEAAQASGEDPFPNLDEDKK